MRKGSVLALDVILDRHTMPEPNSGCVIWIGALDADGYAKLVRGGKWRKAHRVVYENVVGLIPDGKELDHLCRVRRCVNPAHLEAVSHKLNTQRSPVIGGWMKRRAVCHRGHDLTRARLYTDKNGWVSRVCLPCIYENRRTLGARRATN